MPDFRHKCLSQIESQHSIRLLTTGTEQRWSSEETPKSEDRSIYSAAKYTESDAHRKHRSYQNYRCKCSQDSNSLFMCPFDGRV